MTVKSRKELLQALIPMYLKVTWKEKQKILDGFVAATGYNRKHAIVLLNDTQIGHKKTSRGPENTLSLLSTL